MGKYNSVFHFLKTAKKYGINAYRCSKEIAMFSLFAIALLSSAAVYDAESARVSYSNCLVDFSIKHLDLKTGASAFKKAAKSACAAERRAMISMIQKDEKEFGSTDAEAIEYATEEADNVLFSFSDGYSGYISSNTRPVREQ